MSIADADRELLRKAIRRYLVMFHPSAFTAEQIRRALPLRSILDFEPDVRETESALAVLEGFDQISKVRDPVGSSVYWSATSRGVIEQERQGR